MLILILIVLQFGCTKPEYIPDVVPVVKAPTKPVIKYETKTATNIKRILTTNAVTSITKTSAICGGNITFNGGTKIAWRGICWNTLPNPTILNNFTSDNGMGYGTFTCSIIGLTAGVTYYVRAFAENGGEATIYGNQITFTTSPRLSASPILPTTTNTGTYNITQTIIFTSGIISFNYTVDATGGVTGFTTPVTGLPNNFVISNILHNPTSVPQTVTYTIIPINSTGCAAGLSQTVVFTVNPTLNDTINLKLTSPTTSGH